MTRRDGTSAARPGRRRGRSQAIVETALVFPIFVIVVLSLLEVPRLVFTRALLESNARAAARAMAIDDGATGDCRALRLATDSGGGLVDLRVDPASHWTSPMLGPNQPPAPVTAPTEPNTGYVYLYPATTDPSLGSGPVSVTNCTGCGEEDGCILPMSGDCSTSQCVDTVYETYRFVPRIPLPAGLGAITIQVSASERRQASS